MVTRKRQKSDVGLNHMSILRRRNYLDYLRYNVVPSLTKLGGYSPLAFWHKGLVGNLEFTQLRARFHLTDRLPAVYESYEPNKVDSA